MQPRFNIERERHNRLFYKEYENDSCVLQFHSHIELYFVDEGEMEFLVNGHFRVLSAGELSVALSYDSHAYVTPSYSRSSVLIIPVYMCERFIEATKNKKASYPFILDTSAVSRIKECISALKRDGINEIEQLGYIHVILGIVMDCIFFKDGEHVSEPAQSTKLLVYVNENFKNDISLSEVSARFGYNPSYISRYFKNCFNIGLNHYIKVIRLKNAVLLMQEDKHNITYCALESGFNSMCTFYRAFFEEFGCTPREYLK